MSGRDPHGDGRVAWAGAPIARARSAVILVHGRGGTADGIMGLAEQLALPDLAYAAPQAAGNSWWPQSFLEPLEANEPGLSSGLAALRRVAEALTGQGIEPERIALLGFSQGACLALEYAARSKTGLHAVFGLSGGLVGTGEAGGTSRDDLYGRAPKRFDYAARLEDVPVYLGCHERDPHIPLARVRETARAFEGQGAKVTTRIHPGAGHGVMAEDLRAVRGLLNH